MPSFKWSSMERDAAEWCSYTTYQLGHANKSYLVSFTWGNSNLSIKFSSEWLMARNGADTIHLISVSLRKYWSRFKVSAVHILEVAMNGKKVQLLYDFMWCIMNHLFFASLVIAVCSQQPWKIPQPLTYPINMRVTALSEIASSVCLSCLAIFHSLCLCYYEASAAPDSSTGRWYSEYTWSNSLFERSSLLQIKAHKHTALDGT